MKTLEKLKQYLANTSKEEFDKHWNEVKGLGVTGSTLNEFEVQLKQQPKPVAFNFSNNKLVEAFYSDSYENYSEAA